MITNAFRSIKKFIKKKCRESSEIKNCKFLNEITGVIHIGANTGQERELYDKFGLDVLWIEPNPEVFQILESNLEAFPKQRAIQYLVTDQDNKEYEFHLACNDGASSSILNLKLHRDIWPDVTYEKSIILKSKTLKTIVDNENIDLSKYQALVMDTQGSELLVLLGCGPILYNFRYIKTEVPDFESYEDCCQLADIELFMKKYGYKEITRHKFASRLQGGSYFDIVYKLKRRKNNLKISGLLK